MPRFLDSWRAAATVVLLFDLITARYARRATVVTTNLVFAEWVNRLRGATFAGRITTTASLSP